MPRPFSAFACIACGMLLTRAALAAEPAPTEGSRVPSQVEPRSGAVRVASEATPSAEDLLGQARAAYAASRSDFDATRRQIATVQTAAAVPPKPSSGFVPLPVLFYGPETDLGFGAFAMYYFHTGDPRLTRTSSVRSTLVGTTRKQVQLSVGPDLWLNQDALHLDSELAFRYFPDALYGIGNDTPSTSREGYTERSWILGLNAQARVVPRLYAGLRARIENRQILDREPDKLLAAGAVHAASGGFVAGGGPALTFDTRDNVNSPRRGAYLDLTMSYYPRAFGSDFRFVQARVDLRTYISVGRVVLAFQTGGEASSGETPFYLYPRLGGGVGGLRGIPRTRYRDNILLQAQAEVRVPIVWRFGAVGFAGAGEVAHATSDLRFSALRPIVGTGLRFAVVPSERINIRLDVAFASEGLNYYLDIGEAF